MRKSIGPFLLMAVAILMIYKFRTPSPIANTDEVILNAEPEALVAEEIQQEREIAMLAGAPESTKKKITILKDILTTKNDNDPRMDTELKNLSSEDKDALVSMYQNLKSESLNDRGTIVFLIGRELNRAEDAEFLKSVLSEEPCLSLENCGVTNSQTDPHMDSVNEVSLNYPQVVALNRMKNFLETQNLENVNPTILSHLADASKIGENSKIGMVQSRSKEISYLLTKTRK